MDEYRVEKLEDEYWVVRVETYYIARCDSKRDAAKVAKALNEAEGL